MEVLIKLFLSFLKIGAFSFGGGYAMFPLIEEEIIQTHNWITYAGFTDVVAIAEITPGPIGINSATFIGYKVAGVLGSLTATFAVVIPSFLIMSLIFVFINKFKESPYVNFALLGIRPVVLGLIASAVFTTGKSSFIDIKSFILAIGVFYLVTIKKLNPIMILIASGIMGIILY